MNAHTEENYLKAIFKICKKRLEGAYTNDIAYELNIQPSSVSEALKKLSEKGYIQYVKYKAVTLTEPGKNIALKVIRNHRLWEVFLVEKLGFGWDEIHPMAEEMEHINFELMTDRLEKYLGYPKYDPHGDPIPSKEGNIVEQKAHNLSDISENNKVIMTGVENHSPDFLQYLNYLGICLGAVLTVRQVIKFDKSMILLVEEKEISISNEVAKNILVTSSAR